MFRQSLVFIHSVLTPVYCPKGSPPTQIRICSALTFCWRGIGQRRLEAYFASSSVCANTAMEPVSQSGTGPPFGTAKALNELFAASGTNT
jgi:hypothetical protein